MTPPMPWPHQLRAARDRLRSEILAVAELLIAQSTDLAGWWSGEIQAIADATEAVLWKKRRRRRRRRAKPAKPNTCAMCGHPQSTTVVLAWGHYCETCAATFDPGGLDAR